MTYIWIRRTVDWADEEAAAAALTDRWLIPKVPAWNATFNLSYQTFRRRVAEIADLNHSRVEGAVRAEWEEIPDGALVLPVDDDDWFRPDAALVLAGELRAGVTVYHWQRRWVELPMSLGHRLHILRMRLLPRTRPKYVFATNSYAMVKAPGAKELLVNHARASRLYARRIRAGDTTVRWIDDALSCANRTLGSQTSLGIHTRQISRAELVRKYHRHRRLYGRALPTDLAWCRPYVEMMAELMDELEVVD